MASKTDFTAEEWQLVTMAPQLASLYITFASPSGLIGAVKEVAVYPRLIVETLKNSSDNSLVNAVAHDFKEMMDRKERPQLPVAGKKPDEVKTLSLQKMGELAAVLATKSLPEADGFKQWVYKVARGSAEASKEGGFLGFGGTQVNEAEATALQEIATALMITV